MAEDVGRKLRIQKRILVLQSKYNSGIWKASILPGFLPTYFTVKPSKGIVSPHSTPLHKRLLVMREN